MARVRNYSIGRSGRSYDSATFYFAVASIAGGRSLLAQGVIGHRGTADKQRKWRLKAPALKLNDDK